MGSLDGIQDNFLPRDLSEIRLITAMCYALKLSPAAGMIERPLHPYNGRHSVTNFRGEKGKFRFIFAVSHSPRPFSGIKRSRKAGRSVHQAAFKALFCRESLTNFGRFRYFLRLQRLLQQHVQWQVRNSCTFDGFEKKIFPERLTKTQSVFAVFHDS